MPGFPFRSDINPPYLFDVTAYGAQGDGTTDDAASIQAAINAAAVNGGGIVYFPVFKPNGETVYLHKSTLNVSSSNIALLGGAPPGSSHDVAYTTVGATLLWGGASGGTQVVAAPTGTAVLARLYVKELSFIGNGANIGLQLLSCAFPVVEDVFFSGHHAQSLYLGSVTSGPLAEQGNLFHGMFTNISIDNGNILTPGDGIYLTGGSYGNCCFNTFSNLLIRTSNGHCFNVNFGDNNQVFNLQAFASQNGGTGDSVRLQASAFSNRFQYYSGGPVRAQTGSGTSGNNSVIFIDTSNGVPAPIIEGTAQIWYGFDNGVFNRLNAGAFYAYGPTPQSGTNQIAYGASTSTTATAGGGQALPATVLTYIEVSVNNTLCKIPVFAS